MFREFSHLTCASASPADRYDTAYTERYMGQPRFMREEYERASLLSKVKVLLRDSDASAAGDAQGRGSRIAASSKRLLLIHGLMDDNVHARHVLLLLQVALMNCSVSSANTTLLQQFARVKEQHVSACKGQLQHSCS
jgi:hypothetical protein